MCGCQRDKWIFNVRQNFIQKRLAKSEIVSNAQEKFNFIFVTRYFEKLISKNFILFLIKFNILWSNYCKRFAIIHFIVSTKLQNMTDMLQATKT